MSENEKLVELLLHRSNIFRKMNATAALTLDDEAAAALAAAEARIKVLSEALALVSGSRSFGRCTRMTPAPPSPPTNNVDKSS